MESRSCKLLECLRRFYKDENNLNNLLNVVQNEAHSNTISLRLLDWLVSNYAKAYNIIYYVDGLPFNMHQNYKNMLKAYSKKMFDPFRRHARIYIPYTVDNRKVMLETTVAQLMFFKWAIENQVIQYAHNNRVSIKYHMDMNTKHRIYTNKIPTKTKRSELSKPKMSVNMYRVNITVTFA